MEQIREHEEKIEKLKRDMEAAGQNSQAIPRRGDRTRDRPPVIDLEATQTRADPDSLLPLGDPDNPTPPFTQNIMRAHILRKFKMPTIKAYDGTGDPANHVRTFSNAMLL